MFLKILKFPNSAFSNSHEAKLGRFQIMSEMVPNYFVHRIKFKRRVFSGVFTPNGKYFVTSSQDFVIHVYDGNRISAPGRKFKAANSTKNRQNRKK